MAQKEPASWGSRDLPENPSVPFRRIADQIDFFNARSKQNQTQYKRLKAATIIFASVITVSAAIPLPPWVVPVLGACIVVVEGLIHLNAMMHNWLSYRNTCETLKHEKYLCLSKAGPYGEADDPERLLSERTEEILSRERFSWISCSKIIRRRTQSLSRDRFKTQECS